MPNAGDLLRIYSIRLGMNQEGLTTWSPGLRKVVEDFVERLGGLAPEELIEIDANLNREPIARFIRAATKEVLAEINQPPE